MSWLMFAFGATSGTVVTTLLMIVTLSKAVGSGQKERNDRIERFNEDYLTELKIRNDIGRRQVEALERIELRLNGDKR